MELEPAVRRYLLNQPAISGYVQDRVYTYTLHTHVSPHGHRAIVLRRSSGWARPEQRSMAEFPLLFIDCWADRSRNADGEGTGPDEVANAYALYRALDPLLQGVRGQTWGSIGSNPGLPVVSVERWSEPFHVTAGNNATSEALPYGVPLQQAAVVTVAYAVQTHH